MLAESLKLKIYQLFGIKNGIKINYKQPKLSHNFIINYFT